MNPETIRTLLEQQSETTDPMRSGNGGGDTGLRLMPHSPRCLMSANGLTYAPAVCTCHLRAYVELDRIMDSMRDDRIHSLIQISDERVSLRALHWHVHQRYRRVEITLKTVRYASGRTIGIVERPGLATSRVTPLNTSQAVIAGDPLIETHIREQRHKRSKNARDIRVLVASWHRDVREPLVKLGVEWIADKWALERVAPVVEDVAA